tara:strand:- start:96 stop:413 length:318 start_codon:yes stop_codon:yes gene_type:complete
MAITEITDETFEEKVMKSSKIWCLRFTAEWCSPCKQLAPIVEQISEEIKDVEFGVMDLDSQPNIPTKFGVRGIPTCVILDKGEVKSTKVGLTSHKDFTNWIKENI